MLNGTDIVSGDEFTVDYVLSLKDYEVNGVAGLFNYDKELFELISLEINNEWIGSHKDGKFLYLGEESLTIPEEELDVVQIDALTAEYVLLTVTFKALHATTEEDNAVITLEEIELFNSNEDGSMNEREILRMLSIKAWKEKPIVGHGLHSFRYYSLLHNGPYLYSHCNYTELLSTLGIIGFLLYYSAYIYLIVACIKYRKKNKYYIFFLAFLLMNLVSDYSTISYYRQHYLIIFFTISRAILKNKNEERNVIKW